MTSERLLLRFFDLKDFLIGYGDTIGFSEDKIKPMTSIEKEIRDSKRISGNRIGPITLIGTPEMF